MSTTQPVAGTRFALLGSEATRGVFDLPEASSFELRSHFDGTSLGSFMGRRSHVLEPDYHRIDGKERQLVVGEDIAKLGRKRLRTEHFDVLVLDAINDRFPLALFPDGGLATLTSDFRTLGTDTTRYTKIHPLTEESWNRWRAGWTSLINLLDQLGARDRLIVHRAFWAAHAANGASTVEDPHTVSLANRWLERIYDHMTEALEPHQLIEVESRHRVAAPDVHWAVAPFSYEVNYYRLLLQRLQEVAVRG